jgi:hypothetical protein
MFHLFQREFCSGNRKEKKGEERRGRGRAINCQLIVGEDSL